MVANYRINGNTGILFDEVGDQFHLGDHLVASHVPNIVWSHITSPNPVFCLRIRKECYYCLIGTME